MTAVKIQSKFKTIDLDQFNVQKKLPKSPPLSPIAASSPGVIVSQTSTGTSLSAAAVPTEGLSSDFVYFEPPEYPKLARLKGLEGKVKIKVTFDSEGKTSKIEILESSSHALLDEAVTKSALKWRVVKSHPRVFEKTFEFKLNN
jgi:protein TonB